MRHARSCVKPFSLAFALLASMLGAAVSQAGSPFMNRPDRDARASLTLSVTHASIATVLVTPGSTGHELGDLRVLPATPVFDADAQPIGRLDAQLLTTSIDYPLPGDEVRMSTLNFVFGEGDAHLAGSADQIVVSGSGYYPAAGGAIAAGRTLVRPVVGGSGRYAGATGWAETEHLDDGSWRHTLHVAPAGAAGWAAAWHPDDDRWPYAFRAWRR